MRDAGIFDAAEFERVLRCKNMVKNEISEKCQVEESLKSARLTHWMLILVCATLLSAAFHQREDYSGAINELDSIIDIDMDQFLKDSIQETDKLGRDSEFARGWADGFNLLMRYELDKIGLDVSASDTRVYTACASFDLEQVIYLQRSRLVRDYRDFLIDNIGIDSVDFGAAIVATAFAEKMKNPNILRPGFLPGTKLAFMTFTMNSPIHDPSGTRNFSAEMSLGFQFAEFKHVPVNVTITAPPVWRVDTFEGTEFQNWLRNHDLLNGLVDGQPRRGGFYAADSIFPQLRSVWFDVKDKTPEEAKLVLSEKAQRKISFFGVEIDVALVVVAGPLLVCFILWYLLCVVLHLRRICKHDLHSLSTIPWIPLFAGKIAWVLCFISIPVLPMLTLFLLCWQFRDINGWTQYISWIVTVFSVCLSIICWRAIHELKKSAILSS